MDKKVDISALVRENVAVVMGVAPEEISMSTDLAQSFDIDSLEVMEIGTRIENAINMSIDPFELKNISRVGDIVEYLESKMVSRR